MDVSAQDILATVRVEQDRNVALERRVTDNATRVSDAQEAAALQRAADTDKIQRTQGQQRVANQTSQRRIDAEQDYRNRQLTADLRATQDLRERANQPDAEPLPRGSLVDLVA